MGHKESNSSWGHKELDTYDLSIYIDHLVLNMYYLSSQNMLSNLTLLQMGKMRI